MNSLLWKQWRETRGILAIFTAWMTIAVCYAIAYELGHHYRAVVGHFSGWALLYSLFAAVVLATRTSHGERTDGTIAFSAALPISMRRIATIRIASAVATLGIPLVIAAGVLSMALACGLVEQVGPRLGRAYTQLPQRETAALPTSLEQLWSIAAIAILGGVELLLLLSLLGCYLRSQAQIGLMGAVMALGSMIAATALWFRDCSPQNQLIYGILLPQSLAIQWSYGEELGYYTDHELAQYRWIAMGLSLPVLAIIGHLFITRYGALRGSSTPAKRRRFRIAFPPILARIPIRLPGRLPAMIWLELRQSMPLAAFGLLLGVLMSIASVLIEHQHGYSFGTSLLMDMPHSTAAVAMLWAIVVGSGLYSADLSSGLGAFWRSRPIAPDLWFWTKFVVGLAAVMGVLDGATILISWKTPPATMTTGMSWAYVGCFPIFHSLMYALAVFGTCWFRRPVIGGILAILGYTLLHVAITTFPMTDRLEPINVYNAVLSAELAGQVDFTQHGYPLVYGASSSLDYPARAPLMPIGQTTSANMPLVPATNEITGPPTPSWPAIAFALARISASGYRRECRCVETAIRSATIMRVRHWTAIITCVSAHLLTGIGARAGDLKPYPLPPETSAEIEKLAARSDILILGEMHGTQDVPELVATLLAPLTKLGYGTLALEVPNNFQATLRAWA